MDTLVNELNTLLVRERGLAEAAKELVLELNNTDPDIADSAADIVETAKWVCAGLYRRISQLNASPTLDVSDLAGQLADKPDTKSKIKLLCVEHNKDHDAIKRILKRHDVDDDTRGVLADMEHAHSETDGWYAHALAQWKRDI